MLMFKEDVSELVSLRHTSYVITSSLSRLYKLLEENVEDKQLIEKLDAEPLRKVSTRLDRIGQGDISMLYPGELSSTINRLEIEYSEAIDGFFSYLNSTELKSHFEKFEDGQERDMNVRRHIKTMLDASIKSYINLSGAKRDAKLGDLKNEVSLNKWGAVFRNRRDEWTNKAVFETLKKRLTQAIVSLKEQSLPEQVREERYLQGVARILTEELGDDMFVVLTQMLEPTDEVAELATQIPKVVERTFNQLKNQIIQLYQETE